MVAVRRNPLTPVLVLHRANPSTAPIPIQNTKSLIRHLNCKTDTIYHLHTEDWQPSDRPTDQPTNPTDLERKTVTILRLTEQPHTDTHPPQLLIGASSGGFRRGEASRKGEDQIKIEVHPRVKRTSLSPYITEVRNTTEQHHCIASIQMEKSHTSYRAGPKECS